MEDYTTIEMPMDFYQIPCIDKLIKLDRYDLIAKYQRCLIDLPFFDEVSGKDMQLMYDAGLLALDHHNSLGLLTPCELSEAYTNMLAEAYLDGDMDAIEALSYGGRFDSEYSRPLREG